MDSILVYSKYSNNSKRLIDLIQNSNVDFSGLKSLCVDNDKIRKRIKQNPHLDVTTVPCILNIYANGTVEKFEGAYAFSWVEKIIALNAPKVQEQYVAPIQQGIQQIPQQQLPQYQPMLPQQPMVPQQGMVQQGMLPQQGMVQSIPQQGMVQQVSQQPMLPQQPIPQQGLPTQTERQDYVPQSLEKKPKPRRKPIQQKQELTPLDELDENDNQDESEPNDRYRNVPGPKRIRNSHQGYEEDDDLFPGDQVDNRRERKNTIRNNTEKAISDPHGTAAKAREIEQMRNQEMESSMQNRPMELRRP